MKPIRLLLLALFLLLAGAVSASAQQIQVQSFTVNNFNGVATGASTAAPELRLYINVDTTFKDGTSLLADSPTGNNINYVAVLGSVVGTTLTFPTFNLEPTTNATPNTGVYNAWIFSATGTAGVQVQPFPQLSGVAIPSTIATLNPLGCSPVGLCAFIPDIVVYNKGPLPVNTDFMTYSRSEIDAKIAGVQTGAPGTEKFIVQTPDAAKIPNAQALNTFATGTILKVGNGPTGVLAGAIAGTDYISALLGTTPITITGGNTVGLAGLTTLGTANQILGMNNAATAYEYKTVSIGSSGSSPNIAFAANSIVVNIPTASPTVAGIVPSVGNLAVGTNLSLAGSGTNAVNGGNITISLGTAVPTSVVNDTNIQGSIAANALTLSWAGILSAARGGTGVNNSNTITLGGNLLTAGAVTFSGAFSFTGTLTAATSVTFPTSGTLVNSAVTTLSSLVSVGTITTGVWNGTAISSSFGGTGQNWGGSSGLPSINAGAFGLNAITQNGVAYGGAANAISFSNALANAVLITSGSSIPTFVTPAADIVIAGSSIDTVQPILTTSTPQFGREGLNQVAAAVTKLGITGPDMSASADQTVGSLQLGSTLASNNAGGGITLFDVLLKPTFNVSAGSSGRTFVTLGIDSTNTQLLGTTTRWLINANDGGTNRFRVVSDGSVLIGTSLAIAGGTALTTTNQTGTVSIVMSNSPTLVTPTLGAALATSINGNTFTTGTYTLTGAASKTLTFNSTLTLAGVDGKTLTANNSLTLSGVDGKNPAFNNSITFAGTDSTTMTFPTTTATIARTDAAQTFTGVQTFSTAIAVGSGGTGATSFTTNGVLYGGATVSATGAPGANSILTGNAGAPSFSQTPIVNTSLQIGVSGQTGSLLLNGTTSGQVTVTVAGAAGTWTMTLPTTAGGASQFLQTNGSGVCTWATPAGTGGTINSATINQMAFYTAASTISGNTGIVTDGFNTLSISPSARNAAAPTYYFRVVTPADTALSASVESIGSQFGGTTGLGTVTRQWATGGLAIQRENVFVAPTYSFVAASNLTTPATVAITDGPIAGTNATFTGGFGQGLSLWSQHGQVEIDHTINMTTAQATFAIPALNITLTTSGANAGGNPTPAGQRIAVTAAGTSSANASLGLAVSMNNNTNPGAEAAALFTATYNQFGSNAYAIHGQCLDQTVGAVGTTEANLSGVFSTVVRAVAITGAKTAHAFVAESTGSQHADVGYGFSQRTPPGGSFDYGLDQVTVWGTVNSATPVTINKSLIRSAYGTITATSRNQANGADVPLLQMGTLAAQNNIIGINQAATATTTTTPGAGVVIGLTSLYNAAVTLAGAIPPLWVQGSDAGTGHIGVGGVGLGPAVRLLRADGTSAALTAIASGDVLGSLQIGGYDGSTLNLTGLIRGIATENWTSAPTHATDIQFFTTASASAGTTENMRIMHYGGIQISNAQTTLPVAGDFVGGSKAAVIVTVKNSKLVFEFNNAGTTNYITIPLDGATTTWTQGSVAP